MSNTENSANTEENTTRLELNHQPSGGKTWVMKLRGYDPSYKYKWKGEFVKPAKKERSSTGKTGKDIFLLEEGIYRCREAWDGKKWFIVDSGEIEYISPEEAKTKLESEEQTRQPEQYLERTRGKVNDR